MLGARPSAGGFMTTRDRSWLIVPPVTVTITLPIAFPIIVAIVITTSVAFTVRPIVIIVSFHIFVLCVARWFDGSIFNVTQFSFARVLLFTFHTSSFLKLIGHLAEGWLK